MPKEPDIHFTPTPERVVDVMLDMAAVGPDDVVYDLGSGDGRIVITAARTRGARGVGVDIAMECVTASRAQARLAGCSERVEFRHEDFFTTDLRSATVLALYLLDSLNLRLRPKIFAECRPGTRVVSYSFEMGDWKCDAHTPIAANGVSLWVVPANLTGRWVAPEESEDYPFREITIEQTLQRITGVADSVGKALLISAEPVVGGRFGFALAEQTGPCAISGWVKGECLEGSVCVEGIERPGRWHRVAGTQRALKDGLNV